MDIIIIGGVAAGAKAAAKVKRLLPSANVVIYTDDTNVSYSSCGLPYYIQGNFEDYKTLLVRSVDEFKASGIDVYLRHRVTKIDPIYQSIIVHSDIGEKIVHYDRLIMATGARPFIPDIDGINDFQNIFTLRKIEDGIRIREKMQVSNSVAILGSGFIGLELLEAFVTNGLNTYVIERSPYLMNSFDFDMSETINHRIDSLSNEKINILTNNMVIKFEKSNEGEDKICLKLSSGKSINVDFVVVATGVVPNSEIAKDAGLVIGSSGAIKVNKLMQTSVMNIYACGDCCEEPHLINGRSVWVPLGSTANKEGRCAAMNAAGIYTVFEGVLGSSVTRCLNTTISKTGFTVKEAELYGYTPISVIINKSDMVSYMPEASDISLKIVADKVTGLLLGGQAVGSIGADKRINALSSALVGRLTVNQFASNDFTYAPPYSTTIDPLLDAMNILNRQVVN